MTRAFNRRTTRAGARDDPRAALPSNVRAASGRVLHLGRRTEGSSLAARCAAAALGLTMLPAMAGAQVGRVAGDVTDEAGKPIWGATVVLENPEVVPDTFTAVTDKKGRFAVIGVRTGVWRFTVSAPGYVSATGAGRLSGVRPNPHLELKLKKAEEPAPSLLGQMDPKTLQAELSAADTLANASRFDEAAASYRAILAKVPSLTALHLQIGRTCRMNGDQPCAVAAYEAAVDAGAAPAKALQQLVEMAAEQGDAEGARRHYDRLVGLAPQSREAVEARALVERLTKKGP